MIQLITLDKSTTLAYSSNRLAALRDILSY